MPKRQDLHTILLIGSGPIVIGQACEFDYSGVQACKALKEEGYRIVLVNNNPATIMTDPEIADRTYLEPLTPDMLKKIIARERPQALLPTMGGQTSLNLAVALSESGVLERYGVELIGAKMDAIQKAEDRDRFKRVMEEIGLAVPRSQCISHADEGPEALERLGLPLIIRPSFTLGGSGGSVAYNRREFEEFVARGLMASPHQQVLIEESILGWKEYELEVMRDLADNVVIVCSIENVDAMGVHTGDSITVAPAQTLSDKEYQAMRDAAIRIIRAIGVETGGSNIQFAVNPDNGDMQVIEMNPGCRAARRWPRRRRDSRSPRSPPSWPWATRWTKSLTTSRASPRRRSSRPSTTASSRCRASPSKNSRHGYDVDHADEVGG